MHTLGALLLRWVVVMALGITACANGAAQSLLIQSTTSTQNSGLFDVILPQFTQATGIGVKVVAVGTGQAIRNARNGDADVLLVHAKSAEQKFIADGFAERRYDLMYNDFVLLGPPTDPATLHGGKDIVAALRKIGQQKAIFASRGDDSGTHKKELGLWQETAIDVVSASGQWYRETGSGMGATLNLAIGMGAYVLADRATWIAFGNKAGFIIHVEGDPKLFNQYGVMAVSANKHPHVKARAAAQFIQWLRSPSGQSAIAAYKRAGQQLFFPNSK
jgi:tungstate transport system substrate-binding protein